MDHTFELAVKVRADRRGVAYRPICHVIVAHDAARAELHVCLPLRGVSPIRVE
jgi:hypothetical protein